MFVESLFIINVLLKGSCVPIKLDIVVELGSPCTMYARKDPSPVNVDGVHDIRAVVEFMVDTVAIEGPNGEIPG
jgi:hypothetical protein